MTPTAAHPAPVRRASRRAVGARVASLFDEHAAMVLGLCRLLLRDHHEAEDAAQQTFVSAYRALLRGTEPREPGPWLAAIARNECRARMRKRMRAPLALEGDLELELSDNTDDLAELADRRAELSQLAVEIAKLPSRQREAIALRDFLGLSYEEVATTLKVSVPVVESLLFRARRRLRDTVRTVPRYAAGIVIVPLALRAAVARDIPDFDAVTVGLGIAGVAGAAAGGVAKLLSLPASVKVAATVAVVATGSVVAPKLIHAPGENAAPRIAAVQGEERDASSQSTAASSSASGEPESAPAAQTAPDPEPEPAEPAAPPPAAEPAPGPAADEAPAAEELDPGRISADVEGVAPIAPPPPPPSSPADAAAECDDGVVAPDETDVPVEGDEAPVVCEDDDGSGAGGGEPPATDGGTEAPPVEPPAFQPPAEKPSDTGPDDDGDDDGAPAPEHDDTGPADAPADH